MTTNPCQALLPPQRARLAGHRLFRFSQQQPASKSHCDYAIWHQSLAHRSKLPYSSYLVAAPSAAPARRFGIPVCTIIPGAERYALRVPRFHPSRPAAEVRESYPGLGPNTCQYGWNQEHASNCGWKGVIHAATATRPQKRHAQRLDGAKHR